MNFSNINGYQTRGDGRDFSEKLGEMGANIVIEDGVRIFHPENVRLGPNGFIGHSSIIDGYYKGHVTVGEGSWVGPFCFLHGAGGLDIGRAVGIGPRVTILTSEHSLSDRDIPVLHADIVFEGVSVKDGVDLGAAAVILPGVSIGEGAVVGAGAVVVHDVPAYAVVAGNPARVIRQR